MPLTPESTTGLLDPTTPKKKPAPTALGPGVQGPLAGGAPTGALDTGIPAATPAPPPVAVDPAPVAPQTTPVPAATPAPAAAAPATAPATSIGVSPAQAVQQYTAAFQAAHGRAPTQADLNAATQQIQAMGWTGGNVPEAMIRAVIGTLPASQQSAGQLANQRLTDLLGLSYEEVDPNSQAIQQPLSAFRSAQSRATDRARMAMALRNQNQGISGGGEDVGLLGLLEEQGQNEAGYEANLYAQELAAQRQSLQQAIELATQAGLQDKARELQKELGKLDIDLRRFIGQGQLSLGARSLDINDKQFLESMGFNYAKLIAEQNARAVEAAL